MILISFAVLSMTDNALDCNTELTGKTTDSLQPGLAALLSRFGYRLPHLLVYF